MRINEVFSTNSMVLSRENLLNWPGLVLMAKHQTGGRGRMGRRWASVPGKQLQFSVVLHLAMSHQRVQLMSLATGVAVARSIENFCGARALLKWPNDLLLGRRKVCGILVETKGQSSSGLRLVIGIGLNCLGGPADFPAEVRELVTTLQEESGQVIDMEALLSQLLEELNAVVSALATDGPEAMLDEWRLRALLRGVRVRIDTPEGQREGRPLDIDHRGALQVATEDGVVHAISSGTLHWLY